MDTVRDHVRTTRRAVRHTICWARDNNIPFLIMFENEDGGTDPRYMGSGRLTRIIRDTRNDRDEYFDAETQVDFVARANDYALIRLRL
jgi:hypothetical protein